MNRIQDLLTELTNTRKYRADIAAEVMAEIAGLQNHLKILCGPTDRYIASIESELRQKVLSHGATVKGTKLWAVYNRGRRKWDTKGLIGYSVAHPEIDRFLTEGDPYVSIRKAKGAK